MNFDHSNEFARELKSFSKKWQSLPEDLISLTKVLSTLYFGGDGLPPERIRETFFASKRAAVLQTGSEEQEVVKVRLDCRDLNKDMLRVTYIRKGDHILLVELYAKNQKAREDVARIKYYLKSWSQGT